MKWDETTTILFFALNEYGNCWTDTQMEYKRVRVCVSDNFVFEMNETTADYIYTFPLSHMHTHTYNTQFLFILFHRTKKHSNECMPKLWHNQLMFLPLQYQLHENCLWCIQMTIEMDDVNIISYGFCFGHYFIWWMQSLDHYYTFITIIPLIKDLRDRL